MPIKHLIDLSLFSGSADTLRTALGGYYEPNAALTGLGGGLGEPKSPQDYFFEVPAGIHDVSTDGGAEGINTADYHASNAKSDRISHVLSRTGDTLGDKSPVRTTVSKNSIMINKKFPVRLIGDPENVFSDSHWEKILIGGMWGKEQIQGIIKDNVVFDDQHMESIYPIDAKVIKRLKALEYSNTEGYGTGLYEVRGDFVEIKPEINHYIPYYQDHTNNLGSELLIPNAYLMTSIELFGDSMSFPITPYKYSEYSQNYWDLNLINFVSREKEITAADYFTVNSGELYYDYTADTPGYDSPYDVLVDDMDSADDYTTEYLTKKYSGLVTKYFPITIPNIPLSSSTETVIQNRMQNVIFDQYCGLGFDRTKPDETKGVIPTVSDETKKFFPYYISIDFYSERASRFSNNINFHSYSSKFLKLLKEVFLGEIELKPKMINYECSYNSVTPSYETPDVFEEYVRETRQLRYVDFLEFLLYSYNNYISETSNCVFAGNPISNPSSLGDLDGFATFQRKAAMDDIGDYRYFNTITTYDVLLSTMRMFGRNGSVPEEHVTTLDELLNVSDEFLKTEFMLDPDDDEETPEEYGMSEDETRGITNRLTGGEQNAVDSNFFGYNEVVAYRIEKVASDVNAEELNTRPIQNFWFINTQKREDINFIDTQIKYDTNYTYNIYSYSICVGLKYKTTDLAITKFTSNVKDDEDTAEEDESELYCLEFFNPETGEPTPELFGNLDESALLEEMSGVMDDGERIYFLSRASVRTRARYLTDFYLHYEPTVRIVENKMYSKTLKALDHPANKLDIEPYQVLDESHSIGYKIAYEPYVPEVFPTTISSHDLQVKEDYMNAYDFLEGDKISGIGKVEDVSWASRQNPNESISRPRYIEVYRLTERPTKYEDFDNNLYETIDLKLLNQKTATYSDQTSEVEFFNDKIEYNKKYYYTFRMLTEQKMFGDVSEIYEAELVYDGNAPYAVFNALFKEDLKQKVFTRPSKEVKKIFQIRPNLQQIDFDDSSVNYRNRAIEEIENLEVGNIQNNIEESIWQSKFKLRLTSKKTNKKIDLNLSFNLDSD